MIFAARALAPWARLDRSGGKGQGTDARGSRRPGRGHRGRLMRAAVRRPAATARAKRRRRCFGQACGEPIVAGSLRPAPRSCSRSPPAARQSRKRRSVPRASARGLPRAQPTSARAPLPRGEPGGCILLASAGLAAIGPSPIPAAKGSRCRPSSRSVSWRERSRPAMRSRSPKKGRATRSGGGRDPQEPRRLPRARLPRALHPSKATCPRCPARRCHAAAERHDARARAGSPLPRAACATEMTNACRGSASDTTTARRLSHRRCAATLRQPPPARAMGQARGTSRRSCSSMGRDLPGGAGREAAAASRSRATSRARSRLSASAPPPGRSPSPARSSRRCSCNRARLSISSSHPSAPFQCVRFG